MLSKLKKAKKGLISFGLGMFSLFLAAPVYALDATPEQPPGTDGILRLIRYAVYLAFIALFVYWIRGLVIAGNKKRHGETDVEAASWPLVAAIFVGAAGGIWTVFTGI